MTALLLNIAHALDHLVLLIFATAVGSIAIEFGFARWEDLMPYTTGAFVLFGLGSIPAGRLGDLWGRRPMMIVFFFGLGVSTMLVGLTSGPWSMAIALTLMGAFCSIYHPVGIPMLLQNTQTPGQTIGVNGLSGNLGVAAAAALSGFLIEWAGWRAAFIVPGLIALACGLAFLRIAPSETVAPARRAASKQFEMSPALRKRILLIMVMMAVTNGLAFNLTTNGNPELLKDRLAELASDPSTIGLILASIYVLASLAQLVVGKLIDSMPIRRLMLGILCLQPVAFLLAAQVDGWLMILAMTVFMLLVFGAIPFTDAIVARFVDDSMRSRVSGLRLAISFTISSSAVWALGPFVKASGFTTLLITLAAITACSAIFASQLPSQSVVRPQK
jgi:MFS family permease